MFWPHIGEVSGCSRRAALSRTSLRPDGTRNRLWPTSSHGSAATAHNSAPPREENGSRGLDSRAAAISESCVRPLDATTAPRRWSLGRTASGLPHPWARSSRFDRRELSCRQTLPSRLVVVPHFSLVRTDGTVLGARALGQSDWPPGPRAGGLSPRLGLSR